MREDLPILRPVECLTATVLVPVLALMPGRFDAAGRSQARAALAHALQCPRCTRTLSRELGASWQCPFASELLLPYRQGTIGDDDRLWLERHLGACHTCSGELTLLADRRPAGVAAGSPSRILRLRVMHTLAATSASLDLAVDAPISVQARLQLAPGSGAVSELTCTLACVPLGEDAAEGVVRIRLPQPLPNVPWLAWSDEELEATLPPAGVVSIRLARIVHSPTPDERRALWELLGRVGLEVQLTPVP